MNQGNDNPKQSENLNIVRHIGGRLKELKRLYNDVVTTKSDMLIHQTLPNHMRRRAMSHNPKRLPLKYRAAHKSQMAKSGLEDTRKKKRRPARRYRRRPRNLMKEYSRRMKKNVWLETHIWHAKRFRMKNLWGYRVPFTPTDKRYRASYKGAVHHCLVQDISYYACIEITGSLEILQAGFKRITSVECGPTLNAKSFLNGSREGNAMIFKRDSYPLHAIARVSFLWRPPPADNDSAEKSIWIFTHPGAYKETLREFIELFDASENGLNSKFTRNPKHVSSSSAVTIVELKDTLNRIQLTGPYSNAVLFKTFKLAQNFKDNWTEAHCSEGSFYRKALVQQEAVWESLQHTGSHLEFPAHGVLALIVQDPRVNRPPKPVKAVNNASNYHSGSYLFDVSEKATVSPIWEKEIRDELLKKKMSNSELCKLRNKNQLVPGTAAAFEQNLQPVPILIVQRPSISDNYRQNGLGSGWDIIVPAAYGLHVWLSLVKFGAKPIGLRERYMILNEAGCDAFDPDSLLGRKEGEQMRKEESERYFRLPPNKRTNYTKMKIASPFAYPFKQLISEWGANASDDFYVLRNRSLLNDLNDALRRRVNFDFARIDANALIPIYLPNEGSNNDSCFNIICLPKKCDIKKVLTQKYFRSNDPVLIEAPGGDENAEARKTSRFDHKKLLKRLRNRRVRLKRKLQATSEYFVKIQKPNTEKIVEEQYKKMCELWLPSLHPTIRNQCSRGVIGYIAKSRFCFSEGRVCAIGYVTRNGLRELMHTFQKFKGLKAFVLTRNTKSQNYYKSYFSPNPQ